MMNKEIEKIKFNAKCLGGSRSIADNQPVKVFEIDQITNGVKEQIKGLTLSSELQDKFDQIFSCASTLKTLSGSDFRGRASSLGVQIESFFNAITESEGTNSL